MIKFCQTASLADHFTVDHLFRPLSKQFQTVLSPSHLNKMSYLGNSVVTDVQFGHLFLVCIKYVAIQEVTCGLFRKISHCS